MKTIALLIVLFTVAGCEAFVSNLVQVSQDWQFVQSVGGIAIGTPQRDGRGHILLPIRCDVSGIQAITVRPTVQNSILVCSAPSISVRSHSVLITIRTTIASDRNRNRSARCPGADLGILPPGKYSVIYRNPDGSQQSLGDIEIPPL